MGMGNRIGFIVQTDPYVTRVGKESLDPALTAASLELPVSVFFIGEGLLHLCDGQDASLLGCKSFTRGWGALTTLSDDVALYVESSQAECLPGILESIAIERLKRSEMIHQMRDCKVLFHV